MVLEPLENVLSYTCASQSKLRALVLITNCNWTALHFKFKNTFVSSFQKIKIDCKETIPSLWFLNMLALLRRSTALDSVDYFSCNRSIYAMIKAWSTGEGILLRICFPLVMVLKPLENVSSSIGDFTKIDSISSNDQLYLSHFTFEILRLFCYISRIKEMNWFENKDTFICDL